MASAELPGWLRLVSTVALLGGAVLLGWLVLAALVRRRMILAEETAGADEGVGSDAA